METLETLLSMVKRVRKFHYLQAFAGDMVKADTRKTRNEKALEAVCRNFSIKGHFEKVCMKAKCSTHSVDIPGTSNNSIGKPIYYNEHRDPVYAHMVSVCDNKHKHLIQFPISTKFRKVRNSVESSKCSTVLLGLTLGRCESHEFKEI